MAKRLIRTDDLGQDWFLNRWTDGSLTIRNSEKGLRIDLNKAEAARLKEICADAADEDDLPDTDPENIYGLASIQQSIEEDRK